MENYNKKQDCIYDISISCLYESIVNDDKIYMDVCLFLKLDSVESTNAATIFEYEGKLWICPYYSLNTPNIDNGDFIIENKEVISLLKKRIFEYKNNIVKLSEYFNNKL